MSVRGILADAPDLIHAGVGMATTLWPIRKLPWPKADVVAAFECTQSFLTDIAGGLDTRHAKDIDAVLRILDDERIQSPIRLGDVAARFEIKNADRYALRLESNGYLANVLADAKLAMGLAVEIDSE